MRENSFNAPKSPTEAAATVVTCEQESGNLRLGWSSGIDGGEWVEDNWLEMNLFINDYSGPGTYEIPLGDPESTPTAPPHVPVFGATVIQAGLGEACSTLLTRGNSDPYPSDLQSWGFDLNERRGEVVIQADNVWLISGYFSAQGFGNSFNPDPDSSLPNMSECSASGAFRIWK
jgi:hypothetical protein